MKRMVLMMACLAALAGASHALAAEISDPVPGHPDLTYFDLMKLVVTDLANGPGGASGHKIVPFRHIEGKGMEADPDPGAAISFDSASLQALAIPGQPNRLLVLVDLGGSDGNVEEAELLGLFALDGAPRLLDVVEVGNDRWTAMPSTPPPMLAAGAPLIVIDSGHSNSNQSYNDTEMIFIRKDRFQLIDTMFTYNEAFCAYQHTQEATYATAPAAGPYRAAAVTVRETVKLTGDECGDDQKPPRPRVKTWRGTYVWDAAHARFVTHSAALKALDAKNAKWLGSS
jgi:hypothetical protein